MNELNRIVLNAISTYGRSLVALCLGLFSSRWILQALGKEDYGLFGVVGGIITFISILNEIFRSSIARFYAYGIGSDRLDNVKSREMCLNRWFNAAVSIHIVFPSIAFVIGYPILSYVVRHWLVIPIERMDAAFFVLRSSAVLALVNMVSVPYIAMYTATQNIIELSFWGVLQTISMFIGAYALLYYQGDRLVLYATIYTMIPIVICICQVFRARYRFDACRIYCSHLFDWKVIRQMLSFSLWNAVGSFGAILQNNGISIIANRFAGLGMNAAVGIATQVSNHTSTLSNALQSALTPAVTTAEGEGNHDKCIRLGFRSCKFATLLLLLFCIPAIIEMDTVLKIWLVSPPEGTSILCRCILFSVVVQKIAYGHNLILGAKGYIMNLQICVFVASIITVLFAWVLMYTGWGVLGVGAALICGSFSLSLSRVWVAKQDADVPIFFWVQKIAIPVFFAMFLSLCAGILVKVSLVASFLRIIITTVASIVVLGLSTWLLVLDCDEKRYIHAEVIRRIIRR